MATTQLNAEEYAKKKPSLEVQREKSTRTCRERNGGYLYLKTHEQVNFKSLNNNDTFIQ